MAEENKLAQGEQVVEKDKLAQSVKGALGNLRGAAQAAPVAPTPPAARSAEPAFQIVAARKRERYLNALVYGDYGVGKTTLIATASEVPKMRDVLFIDAEAGDASIENIDLDLVSISNYPQFARVHEFLRLHCKFRDAWLTKKDREAYTKLVKLEALFRGCAPEEITQPKMYRTVCVDSLTEVQKYCMYQLLGIKIGAFALDMEPEIPQFAEWNRSAEMIRLLVRSFRDLPMHALFVCARAEEQDQMKRYHYNPLMPGKLAYELQGFFDVVGYYVAAPTEGGDVHRRLYLVPGQTFRAKHRFSDFEGKYIDNPRMADLAKYNIKD
jgi:hypothetical protein